MAIESTIIDHYGAGELLARIEKGMEALGKTPSTVTVEDLGPVDEFHIGGRPATAALCELLGIEAGHHVLDIGCGIGGTARLLASGTGCRVTGIDLVPGFVEVARTLTGWTGLGDRISYEAGSALDLPFADASFDAATMLHVGMNIEDKVSLFGQVRRALRPGGMFGVYDVMRTGDGELGFPVPWASEPSTSFLASPEAYQAALDAAGFEVTHVRDRREFAIEFFTAMRRRTAELGGPPPIGLHLIIGNATPDKVANMMGGLTGGIIAPVEIVCRAR